MRLKMLRNTAHRLYLYSNPMFLTEWLSLPDMVEAVGKVARDHRAQYAEEHSTQVMPIL